MAYLPKLLLVSLIYCLSLVACQQASTHTAQNTTESTALSPQQQLGKLLFFDRNLSSPSGQACASCHVPSAGFADPNQHTPISSGVIPGHFGNRNAPTVAYAAFSPPFSYDEKEQLYIGGLFLDGRASNLKDQIKAPFLNPLEMANPNPDRVVNTVKKATYAPLVKQVYGKHALAQTTVAYQHIADALAAYLRSNELNAFNAKYDAYLAGKTHLTAQELRGLKLFEDEQKANCAACHPSKAADDGSPPLFTDFTYDNIGVPKNSSNPFYQQAQQFNPAGKLYVDNGLGGTTQDPKQNGKFKVSTLRNIALTAPYMHNGVFKTLKQVVEFYNTRDVDDRWAAPEVADNVNSDELGDLKLTEQEVDDLVAFLKTLTDQTK